MTGIYDVSASDLIKKAAEHLKGMEQFQPPEWAQFAKTGAHKERPPAQSDWWFMRAAAVLRSVADLGPIGVSKLRTKYGGRKNRGFKPEKFVRGSGNIIRKVLQQLEHAGFVKQETKDIHKGRVLTAEGLKFLSKCASEVKNGPKRA